MNMSFSKIASLIDPAKPPAAAIPGARGPSAAAIGAAPPASLRELAARHRWVRPPETISLRELGQRHFGPQTGSHRLLCFNTYLIHGFEVSFCNLIVLAKLAEKAGMDAREVVLGLPLSPRRLVEKLGIGDHAIVEAFAITEDELKQAFSDVVDGILSAATFDLVDVGIGDILDEIDSGDLVDRFSHLTVEELMDRLGIDPVQILRAFCREALDFLGEKLFGGSIDTAFYVTGDAPDRPQRAREIGRMIARDYDVAALCEVFESPRGADIVAAALESGRGVMHATGPAEGGELASSGLQTLVCDRPIVSTDSVVFSIQGDRLRDADAWSRKGVLLTVVDLGVGRLEVYATHLFNGDGILAFEPGINPLHVPFPPVSPEERLDIQMKQMSEVLAFYAKTHDPDHVAMIVGDLNVDGNSSNAYAALTAQLSPWGFVDVWPYWHDDRIVANPAVKKPRGDTSSREACDTRFERFCGDVTQPAKRTRIDYVFIQQPDLAHDFIVDVTRVQRRPFWRGTAEEFLSDHLGLHLRLITNPKVRVPADP